MRITSVELHPDGSSAVCELSFRDPSQQNSYNVKGITGLDAEEIIPRFYGKPGSSSFYDLVLTKRNIMALIELNPNYSANETPGSLRDDLYKMIATSRKGLIDIWFKDGEDVVATISGYITRTEAAHFTTAPVVQLSIACTQPMLKAPDAVSMPVIALDPSLTTIVDDISTAPHGFKFELLFTAGVASITMSDPGDPDWSFGIIPWASGFLAGDVLYYSSEYNDKYLYIMRAGVKIYLADVIVSGSIWPIMFPGVNNLAITDGPSLDWQSITYHPTFWGV